MSMGENEKGNGEILDEFDLDVVTQLDDSISMEQYDDEGKREEEKEGEDVIDSSAAMSLSIATTYSSSYGDYSIHFSIQLQSHVHPSLSLSVHALMHSLTHWFMVHALTVPF